MLQMCWLRCSSCEPFGVSGSKSEISGSKMSSAFISQHVHLMLFLMAWGELSHCSAHRKHMSSALQAWYMFRYDLSAVSSYFMQ